MQTLIIGGGLAGLRLAHALEMAGHDYQLVEARDRLGGRIKTEHLAEGYFDMGPAWFWPGQPRIDALISQLGLTRFDQHTDGILTFEDEQGRVQRGRGFASMQGSWRLKGGFDALIQALADQLPATRKTLNAQVTGLTKTGTGVQATLANGDVLQAQRVVLAIPPRIAAGLTYVPVLPDAALASMQGIATWMAGHAKAVAVYDTAFWRKAGLSGDATSRRGPMVEIHDASVADGGPYALFGFIGVPPHARQDEAVLRQHLLAQLGRLFGPQAEKPLQLFLKDWALDPLTATVADQAPLYAHPTYGTPRSLSDLWDGMLHLAGTEMAPQFGGYIEGALEAADTAFDNISQQMQVGA